MAGLPPLEAEIKLLTQGALSELNKFLTVLRQTAGEVEKLGGSTAGAGLERIAGGFQEVATAGAAAIKVTDQISAAMSRQVAATDETIIGLRNQAKALEIAAANGLSYAEAQQLVRTSSLEAGAATDKQAAQIGALQGQINGLTAGLKASDAAIQQNATGWARLSAAITESAAAEERAAASTAQLITGLERELLVLQEAKVAGLSYAQAMVLVREANVAASIADPASLGRIQQLQAGIRGVSESLKETSKAAESTLGFFGRIAVFTLAASVIVRGFFALTQAIKDVVTEGVSFNAFLEEGQLAMAGILSTSRQVVDAQGQVVESARAYPFLLEQAAKLQHDVLLANIETLGTGEELLSVYNQVLASSKGQKGSLDDALKASQIILDIEKLRGRAGELIVTEARQFFTAERAVGQEVAQQLGLNIQQQRALRNQGDLMQELITRGQVYLTLGQQLSQTWSGLTSTIATFFSFIAGEAFVNTFTGVKEIMAGMIDTLKQADAQGGLAAALGTSPEDLRELGQAFGELTIAFVKGLAEITNGFISLASESDKAWGFIKQGAQSTLDWLIEHTPDFVSTLGKIFDQITGGNFEVGPPTSSSFAALKKLEDQALLATGSFNTLSGAVQKAADATTISWQKATGGAEDFFKIVNPPNDPGVDKLKKIAEEAAHVATALKQAADAQADYLETIAKITGTQDALTAAHQARLVSIDADLKAQIAGEKAKQDSAASTALAITGFEQQAASKRLQAEANYVSQFIALEQQRFNTVLNLGNAQAALASAQIKDNQSLLQAEQQRVGAEKELMAASGASAQQIFTFTQRELELQKQLLAQEQAGITIKIDRAQREFDLEQRNIEQIIDKIAAIKDLASAEGQAAAIPLGKQLIEAQDASNKTAESIGHLKTELAATGVQADVLKIKGVTAFQEMEKAAAQTAFVSVKSLGDMFDQIITGILQGTQTLGNILSSTGQALGVKFFKQLLVGKGDFDKALIGNISELVLGNNGGILGAIFGTGGALAAQAFSSGFSGIFNGSGAGSVFTTAAKASSNPLAAGFSGGGGGGFLGSLIGGLLPDPGFLRAGVDVFTRGLGEIFTKGLGTGLQSILTGGGGILKGLGGAAGGLIGGFGGEIFSKIFGISGSQEAAIGGKVGGTIGTILGTAFADALGPAGPLLGGFLGDLFGNLFGSLFVSVPTKGTQIRQSVEAWLKEIKVSFADKISEREYFFPETKALAASMFGGNFLEASKHILNDVAGPELAKQLQALGTFLTADQAENLGKPIEQTATTFGNMIADGLGESRPKIEAAIGEIVEKGGVSFAALAEKITSVFKDGAISAGFYKDAITGAVEIFTKDLPAGIDVAKIALESFTKEGIFDLEAFQAKMVNVVTQAKGVQDALTKAITEGIAGNQTRAEVEIAFKTNIQDVIRDMLVAKTIAEGLADVFKDIDLSKPLDSATIDILAGRVGVLYDNVHHVLEAAGALPSAFAATTDTALDTALAVEDILKNVGLTASQITDIRTAVAGIDFSALSDIGAIGTREPVEVQQALDAALTAAGLTAEQVAVIDAGLKAAGLSARDFADSLKDAANISADLAQAAKDATDAASLKGGGFADAIRSAASSAVTDGIKNGASAADIGDAFTQGLGESIASAIENAVVTGFVNAALSAGVLGPALQGITDQINAFVAGKISLEDLTTGVTASFEAAKPAIDALGQALGVSGTALHKMLVDAGLLKDTVQETNDTVAEGKTDYIAQSQVFEDARKAAQDARGVIAGNVEATREWVDATGQLTEPMRLALYYAGLTTDQIDELQNNLKSTSDAAGNVDASTQGISTSFDSLLATLGLTNPQLDAIRASLEAAGLGGGTLSGAMQEVLTNAGLTTPEILAVQKALVDAGLSGTSMADALQAVLTSAGLTAPEIENIKAAMEAAGVSGGGIVDALQATLTAAGLTTPQVEAVRDALAAAGLAGGDIDAALKNVLSSAGLTGSAIDAVKNALDAAGLSSATIAESLAKVVASAGLTDESFGKLRASLGDAAKGADATSTSTKNIADAMRDVVAKVTLLPPPLADAADESKTILDHVITLTSEMQGSVSQANALADALQAAATASKNIQIPASPSSTGFAGGGPVGGSGTGDIVPAMLDPREFVMTPKATAANFDLLKKLNAGMVVRHFAEGGLVGGGHDPIGEKNRVPGPGATTSYLHDREFTKLVFETGSVSAAFQKLTDETKTLTDQIAEVASRRRAITGSLNEQLAQVGGISQLELAKRKLAELKTVIDPLITKFQSGAKLTADELKQAEASTNALRSAVVERYNAEVDAIQQVNKERIDGLNKELTIAKSFQGVAKSLGQTITSLVTGNQSTLSLPAQFAFLQRQAATLRSQLSTAKPEDQADIINQLSDTLQKMLGLDVFQKPSADYQSLFKDILSELGGLQDQAQVRGGGTGDIENAIQKAIDEDTAATEKAITTLREAAVNQLNALAVQENALAAAQQALLQAQLDKLTGIHGGTDDRHKQHEETNRLLTLMSGAGVNRGTSGGGYSEFTGRTSAPPFDSGRETTNRTVIGAQGGFQGGPLQKQQLFLAHPGEYVSIGHGAQMSGSTNVNISHEINVTAPAGADGNQIGRGIESILLQSWRTGSLGSEIRKEIRRNK